MRPLLLDAKPWTPHGYQKRAVAFLKTTHSAALFADVGMGKSATVLQAFEELRQEGRARKMLVVAPLLPAKETWPYEVLKWRNFQHLRTVIVHGPHKPKLLVAAQDADIAIINYEGLAWLYGLHSKLLPAWDVVVFDELTALKTPSSLRSKSAKKLFANTQWRWGLTGTPAPNGYEDLFGQMLALDGGTALGKFKTAFMAQYYTSDPFKPFVLTMIPGAAEKIEQRIAHMVMRIAAADYLELPQRIDDIRLLHMDDALAKKYKTLKTSMLLSLPGGTITAANAGAVYSKLAQLANGAVYHDEEKFEEVHDLKLEGLRSLREELGDQQLLLAYEFRHDIIRILREFPDAEVLSGDMTQAKRTDVLTRWNNGTLKMVCGHPASIGRGLNLQGSNAAHICWFSPPWNLELYDQTIGRLLRQGNESKRIFNHILALDGSIDVMLKIPALVDKDATQVRLLQALNRELGVQAEEDTTQMTTHRFGNVQSPLGEASFGPAKRIGAAPEQLPRAFEDDEEHIGGSPAHRAQIRTAASGLGFSAETQARVDRLTNGQAAVQAPAQTLTEGTQPPPRGRGRPTLAETAARRQAEQAPLNAQAEARPESVITADFPGLRGREQSIPVPAASPSGPSGPSGPGTATPQQRLDAITAMFKEAVKAAMSI